jgi:hypothetical protein
LFKKCAKAHLYDSYEHLQVAKFFRVLYPQIPVKGEEKGFGNEINRGISGERMEIKEGGRNNRGKEKRKEGKERVKGRGRSLEREERSCGPSILINRAIIFVCM